MSSPVSEAVNTRSVFILPFPMLKDLQNSRLRDKIGLWVLFTLGFTTLIVSAGRYATMRAKGPDISVCKIIMLSSDRTLLSC
jgi:hypothetical protein